MEMEKHVPGTVESMSEWTSMANNTMPDEPSGCSGWNEECPRSTEEMRSVIVKEKSRLPDYI